MSTTIKYNNETIATATNQSKLLKTAGTYMEGDVLITDSSPTYNTQAKTGINPSTSSQTITPDSGYDALSSVQINAMPTGTAGTPTATKGTVSNHSVSVTPSVTNTTGYITGSTKTGTAVTVSASELVSGTKSISANGTGIDVTNYASVDVNVPSGVTTEPLSVTQNGTYTAPTGKAYTPVTVNISGGGGPVPKKQINFIDYDGTILHSYTKTEWQSVSTLPSNPSHTGLTAQGWNWTKAQIDAQLTAIPDGDVWVGQMYITTSGDTEIDVSMPEGRLDPILTIAVNGTITVDWGDNTTPDTVTGASLTTRQEVPHTYAAAGDYMIKIHVVSGSFQFYGSTSYLLLRKNTSGNESNVYANCVQAVRFGSGVTSIGNNAFYSCFSLASVTIPSSVTIMGTYVFANCYSLTSVTIPSSVTAINSNEFGACSSLVSVTMPSGVTSIGDDAFYSCFSLASVTIPSGVTSIGAEVFRNCYSLVSIAMPSGVTVINSNTFYNCYSLASATMPSGVTSIGDYAFYSCFSLASVTIPNRVTSIGNYTFRYCYGVAEYHIEPTTPPTITSATFSTIVSDCKIYVPSASLSTYQTATNWSTYASYMVGE